MKNSDRRDSPSPINSLKINKCAFFYFPFTYAIGSFIISPIPTFYIFDFISSLFINYVFGCIISACVYFPWLFFINRKIKTPPKEPLISLLLKFFLPAALFPILFPAFPLDLVISGNLNSFLAFLTPQENSDYLRLAIPTGMSSIASTILFFRQIRATLLQ